MVDSDASFTAREIVNRFNVSLPFFYDVRKTYNIFRTVAIPPASRRGRKSKITTDAEGGILDLLDQDNQAELVDFVDLLNSEYDIEVSKAIVSRKLKQLRVIYKRVKRTNNAQDKELRHDYKGRIC